MKIQEDIARALKEAGRDPSRLEEEFLSCFKPGARHLRETIARRLFRVHSNDALTWPMNHFVVEYLDSMTLRKNPKITKAKHGRRYGTWVYMLVTPELLKEIEEKGRRLQKEREKRKEREERAYQVLRVLRQAGFESVTERAGKIQLNLDDAEALIERLG